MNLSNNYFPTGNIIHKNAFIYCKNKEIFNKIKEMNDNFKSKEIVNLFDNSKFNFIEIKIVKNKYFISLKDNFGLNIIIPDIRMTDVWEKVCLNFYNLCFSNNLDILNNFDINFNNLIEKSKKLNDWKLSNILQNIEYCINTDKYDFVIIDFNI